MVHYLLTSKSMMKRRNKPSKPPGTYFWNKWHLLKKSLRQVLWDVFQKKALLSKQVIAPEDPTVGQDVEVEDSDVDDPDPV
jgi:hypothetical protein